MKNSFFTTLFALAVLTGGIMAAGPTPDIQLQVSYRNATGPAPDWRAQRRAHLVYRLAV